MSGYMGKTLDQLRDEEDYWIKQMDIYDDAGAYQAYARAEMELREVRAALYAKLDADPVD